MRTANQLPGANLRVAAGTKSGDAIFAANRAVGRIALSVAADGGLTRRKRVLEQGSLRARFPHSDPSEPEVVIVNTAGGIAGGDRFGLDFELEPDARLVVTSTSAEKVYRATGAEESAITLRIKVGSRASLTWLPQETILFDRVRLRRTIDIDLDGSASLLLAESIVFGRSAMGESVTQGCLFDRWRVRRDGRLVFAETLRLEDDVARKLAAPAVANAGVAIATVLMIPADDSRLAALHDPSETFAGEVGISTWNGSTVVRFCAPDGAAMRRDLTRVLKVLRGRPLPRIWMN